MDGRAFSGDDLDCVGGLRELRGRVLDAPGKARATRAAERAGFRPPESKPDKRARRLIRALGDMFVLSPEKELSLGPSGQLAARIHGASHALISAHARSLTALWIGTTVAMSASCGSCPFRFMASKNIFCDG